MRRVASIVSLVLPHSSRDAPAGLGRACSPRADFAFSRYPLGLCASPWPIHEKKVAHTLQSHIVVAEIEAQREISLGGLQMHVVDRVEGSLLLSGIILRNLGVDG